MKKLFRQKYPVVRQYDQTDCGPAALLSVLRFYRGDSSLVRLRRLCKTTSVGTSMANIVEAANVLGFDARAVRGEFEELCDEIMPCIAHIVTSEGLSHFAVVYTATPDIVLVGDPGRGLLRLSSEEFMNLWKSKTAVLFKPGSKLHYDKPPSWLYWISQYAKKYETWIYQSTFLGVLYTVLGLANAIFIQLIVDKIIPTGQTEKIVLLTLALFLVLVLRSGFGYFRQRFLVVANKRLSNDICADFLRHLFRLPKSFFDSRKTGDILTRFADTHRVRQLILTLSTVTTIDILIVCGSLSFLFFITPGIALSIALLLLIYSYLLFTRAKSLTDQQRSVMKNNAEVESSYIDSIEGIDHLISFNSQEVFSELNIVLFRRHQDGIERFGMTQARLSLFAEFFLGLVMLSTLGVGSSWVLGGSLSLGQLIAAYSLLALLIPSVNRLVDVKVATAGASVAFHRMMDILLIEPEKLDVGGCTCIDKSVSIDKGSFGWSGQGLLFKNISLTICKGKLSSLWGPSGSGKSTIVNILQRVLDLSSGTLLVDNVHANLLSIREYRKKICTVPQSIKIFNASLLDNILLGRPFSGIEKVTEWINEIGFSFFPSRFENGLLTLIGKDGQQLSGGEKQLLGFLRALWNRPEVLVIDEALTGIDMFIENELWKFLKRYSETNAVLIVSHDLRTILKTDYAFILNSGTIVKSGPPVGLFDADQLRTTYGVTMNFDVMNNNPLVVKA